MKIKLFYKKSPFKDYFVDDSITLLKTSKEVYNNKSSR